MSSSTTLPIRISVALPCFNEEENVAATIANAIAALENRVAEFEIIVVDDGSSDNTQRAALAVAAADGRVRVIPHEQNRGYGAAVRTGLTEGKYEWRFFTDGDGQFDVKDIDRLLPFVEEADLICGYRIQRRDHWTRSLNAFLFNRLVRLLFGVKIIDLNCAFKLIRAEVLRDCPLTSDGAFVNAELLIQAKQKGYRQVEVGVNHYSRRAGKQTGANLRVVLRAFGELARMKWKKR